MKPSNRSVHVFGQSMATGTDGRGPFDAGGAVPSMVYAILAIEMPATAAPDGTTDTPRQAELDRWARLDGDLPLLLRLPQDEPTADLTTAWVTQRLLVDRHRALPPRVARNQHD